VEVDAIIRQGSFSMFLYFLTWRETMINTFKGWNCCCSYQHENDYLRGCQQGWHGTKRTLELECEF
jgi:hypothetical protein